MQLGLVRTLLSVLVGQFVQIDVEAGTAGRQHVHHSIIGQSHFEFHLLELSADAPRRLVGVQLGGGPGACYFARRPDAGRAQRLPQPHVHHVVLASVLHVHSLHRDPLQVQVAPRRVRAHHIAYVDVQAGIRIVGTSGRGLAGSRERERMRFAN
ncbi:hypothetical protein BpHYR1_011824 [Brachionus plicatilis]|uniref:Secreted protein n=1 Tax=Brachionus plicatilis TaxID=10195 RepID=A0A3M7RW56_BRAPC|nr:hypothetical protein BpHYR1_011824 [Brachionus plicatilis]